MCIRDRDNTMIVAEAAATSEGGGTDGVDGGTDEDATDAISRMILLPLNFVVGG